ncbi:MAG: metalloregulator ArsR/SmtB family transcription factor [Coriobacteriia bacterium]
MDIDVLKALADENRLAIVRMLADGEHCVCDLATGLDLSDALVSHHLKRLRDAGLVKTRRVGTWLHCSLEPAAFAALAAEFSGTAVRATQTRDISCACNPASTRKDRS